MPEKTDLVKIPLKYGGKCAQCGEFVNKGEEAWYGGGKVYHIKCVDVKPEGPSFEDEVIDRLADLADRCHRIEDKLVSLCPPIKTVEDAMGGKK